MSVRMPTSVVNLELGVRSVRLAPDISLTTERATLSPRKFKKL